MPYEQLNLLDLDRDVPPRPQHERGRPTRRRDRAPAPSPPAAPSGGVTITHIYPAAWTLLCEHGPEAVAVLHALAVEAVLVDGALVATASTRGLAQRLGFLCKDSVHRRLRQLRRAGLIEVLPAGADRTEAPSYVLRLDGTGLSVASHHPNG